MTAVRVIAEPFASKTFIDPDKDMWVDGRKVVKAVRFEDPGNQRWRLYPLPDPSSVLPQPVYFAFRDQTIIACDRVDTQSFVLLDSFSIRHFLKVLPR